MEKHMALKKISVCFEKAQNRAGPQATDLRRFRYLLRKKKTKKSSPALS